MFTFSLDDNVCLRLLEDADADALYELIAANRDLLARWMPWAAEQTPEGTAAFISSGRQQWAANNGFQAGIIERGAIAGVIGFSRMDWANRSVSLGYWLAEASHGRGIMTNATRALVDYAFSAWQLNRLEIRTGTENVRSQRIPERLGFAKEGVMREAERIGDRYIDHVLYSTLARDWER